MIKKSLTLSSALCGAFIAFTLPAHAEQKACSDAEPHCISHQFQTSVVDQALLSATIATPEQGGSQGGSQGAFPIQNGGPVPKGVVVAFDTDNDGFFEAADLDGDGIVDVEGLTISHDLYVTNPADLDKDGNIDIGTGGDGTIFVDGNQNGIADPYVDWIALVNPNTGVLQISAQYAPDSPSLPQPRIAGNALGAQPSDDLGAGEDKNSDHNVAAASGQESGGEAIGADEASNAFSGPRPRCPDDYHGNGNSGGEGEGGGRPGRQSDGGGGRP